MTIEIFSSLSCSNKVIALWIRLIKLSNFAYVLINNYFVLQGVLQNILLKFKLAEAILPI